MVERVFRPRLGDMSDADARAEGLPDIASYKEWIASLHKGMLWRENHQVWVHEWRSASAVD